MSATAQTEQLADLISAKHQVLTQLHALSQYQVRLAGHDDYLDELMRVLSAKQTLIERLTSVERQLDPFRRQEPESRVWKSSTERAHCSRKAQECETLLTELKQLEQQSASAVVQQRDAVAELIRSTQTSCESVTAYNNLQSQPHSGFDLTAE